MLQKIKDILAIQELDMKMMRLMRVKKQRQKKLEHIDSLRQELKTQLEEKETEISQLDKTILLNESKIQEIKDKIKRLEDKQASVKKVEEFNALTQELTEAEREKITTSQVTSDLIDKKNLEEEVLEKIKTSLITTEENSVNIEKDIHSNISQINQEGKQLLEARTALAKEADPDVLKIYEKLLRNKKDRVIVPIENRTCNGCHIALTAQHENMVRKGERLVFCEHCSRILYWQEPEALEATGVQIKRRRRRTATS